jgi:hypothetical protein
VIWAKKEKEKEKEKPFQQHFHMVLATRST